MEAPPPIPLRTLTTLLNYERCVANCHFEGSQLLHSTVTGIDLISRLDPGFVKSLFTERPKSVITPNYHQFSCDNNHTAPPTTPATHDTISLVAEPAVHALSFAQLELIYNETRAHDNCYQAIELFQLFFDLCPPKQQLSIQITSEPPFLIPISARQILDFKIKGPKHLMVSTGVHAFRGIIGGGTAEVSDHCAFMFNKDASPFGDFSGWVVDMTRMQYGEAGRGDFGELCWMGTIDDFLAAMPKICEDSWQKGQSGKARIGSSEFTDGLRGCAERVWSRWENRHKEAWCAYCGVGAKEKVLLRCDDCDVWYCCLEHQKSASQLHEMTCEKNRKEQG